MRVNNEKKNCENTHTDIQIYYSPLFYSMSRSGSRHIMLVGGGDDNDGAACTLSQTLCPCHIARATQTPI